MVRGYQRFEELANALAGTRLPDRQLLTAVNDVMPIPQHDEDHKRIEASRAKVVELRGRPRHERDPGYGVSRLALARLSLPTRARSVATGGPSRFVALPSVLSDARPSASRIVLLSDHRPHVEGQSLLLVAH